MRFPRPLVPGESMRVVIRPERVSVDPAGPNTVPARVAGVMDLGDHSEVRLELVDGTRLLAGGRGRAGVSGERVDARLPERSVLEAR